MGQQFIRAIREQFSGTVVVTATFYSGIPHFSAPDHGVDEWQNEQNRKLVLSKLSWNGVEIDVPPELFDSAAYVELAIEAPLRVFTFGKMECKGLLPRHIVFSVDGITVNAPQKVMENCVGKYRPSKWWFGRGDGFECCHTLSLS